MRTCCRCKIEKELNCFTKSSRSSDSLNIYCRDCNKIQNEKSQRYTVKIYGQEEIKQCYTCLNEFIGIEINNNFNTSKFCKDGLRTACKKCSSFYMKEHNKLPEVRYRRIKRYHTDTNFYMKCTMSNIINGMCSNLDFKKEYRTEEYVGLNKVELYHYLQEEFFNSNGSYPNPTVKYHVDHIKPLDAFKKEPKEEQMKASRYYNLRLLDAKTNGASGKWYHYRPEDKIIYEARKAAYELQLLNGNSEPQKICKLPERISYAN